MSGARRIADPHLPTFNGELGAGVLEKEPDFLGIGGGQRRHVLLGRRDRMPHALRRLQHDSDGQKRAQKGNDQRRPRFEKRENPAHVESQTSCQR